MTAALIAGGLPAGARHVRQAWVLRGFTLPHLYRLSPSSEHEGHRNAVRETWDRLAQDRWVYGWQHPDTEGWQVEIRDGRSRLVGTVCDRVPVRDARHWFDHTIGSLLAEAAARPGTWLPAPGRSLALTAAAS